MMTKAHIKISKYLSLVLRHKPEVIGITLDENGWTSVEELIEKFNEHGRRLNREMLDTVVEHNNKKRFAYNEDKTKIRASQGHSVEVNLGYEPQIPPKVLYHGTSVQYVTRIEKEGLVKQKRHHVHLSTDEATAFQVGQRHGKPVIFEVQAANMYAAGYAFFVSANGVWLTDIVPAAYLNRMETATGSFE